MSTLSKTEIANLALKHARQLVVDGDVETSNTANAEEVRAYWAQTVAETVQRVKPNFAKRRKTLAKDAASPDFGWENQFTLPADFIELSRFNGDVIRDVNDQFEIENGKLLTDEGEANVVYFSSDLDDTSKWTAGFVEAFALQLGSHLTNSIRGDANHAQALFQMSEMAASQAGRDEADDTQRANSRDQVLGSSRWTRSTRRASTNETS